MTQITKIIKEITHLQPDILECEVKWLFESITTNKDSGDDGTPAELSVTAGLEKVSFSFEIQRRIMQKNVQSITKLPLFHKLYIYIYSASLTTVKIHCVDHNKL